MPKWTRAAAIAVLALLFAVNVWRARTQSITIDEAFTYNLYLTTPWKDIFTHYDANNHVLYTLLARTAVRWFGRSEFAFRLPSLLAGLLYFWAVYRLARLLFGTGLLFLLALGITCLNPYVLDFFSAARGYGLALALFLWGLLELTRYLAGAREHAACALYRGGVAFGLAVAANLTILFPVSAALVVFAGMRLAESGLAGLGSVIDNLALPALVVAALILILPLAHAGTENFYYGSKSLSETSLSLVYASAIHHPEPGIERLGPAVLWVAYKVIPALFGVLGLWWLVMPWLRQTASQGIFLLTGSLMLTLALADAAHRTLGILFPMGRTGLYLPVLFGLTLVGLVQQSWSHRWSRVPAAILAAALVLLTGWFLARWNVRVYSDWPFDATTRSLVERIRARRDGPGTRVGGTWQLEPSLNFYRHLWRLDWMQPLVRGPADGEFDYYVLLPEDAGVVEKRRLEVIYRSELYGATLAAPRGR